MSSKKGRLFVLSAPSGAGKSSLAKALVEQMPQLGVSISHTTRAPRPGEQEGVHYYFVDKPRFETMAQAGEFLEHARVFDNYYGTSRRSIESLLEQGKNVVLDIDWQGARRIKAVMPDATRTIFILPPSKAALEERLRKRGQDNEAVIARRMRDAVSEMRHYAEFDYVIENDDFARALADLRAVIEGRPEQVRPLRVDIRTLLDD